MVAYTSQHLSKLERNQVGVSEHHLLDQLLSSIPAQESFPHHHQPHGTQVAYGGERVMWLAGVVGDEAAAVQVQHCEFKLIKIVLATQKWF
jgi:hypothetical protein